MLAGEGEETDAPTAYPVTHHERQGVNDVSGENDAEGESLRSSFTRQATARSEMLRPSAAASPRSGATSALTT